MSAEGEVREWAKALVREWLASPQIAPTWGMSPDGALDLAQRIASLVESESKLAREEWEPRLRKAISRCLCEGLPWCAACEGDLAYLKAPMLIDATPTPDPRKPPTQPPDPFGPGACYHCADQCCPVEYKSMLGILGWWHWHDGAPARATRCANRGMEGARGASQPAAMTPEMLYKAERAEKFFVPLPDDPSGADDPDYGLLGVPATQERCPCEGLYQDPHRPGCPEKTPEERAPEPPIDHDFLRCDHEPGLCTKYVDPHDRCHVRGCGESKARHINAD